MLAAVSVAVAVLALHLATLFVLLVAALGGGSRLLGGFLTLGLRGCSPARNLPGHASEALDSEASLSPLSTGCTRSVKGAKSSINSTLISLGT